MDNSISGAESGQIAPSGASPDKSTQTTPNQGFLPTTDQKGQNTMNTTKRSIGTKRPEDSGPGIAGISPKWRLIGLHGPFFPNQDRLHFPLVTDEPDILPEPPKPNKRVKPGVRTVPDNWDAKGRIVSSGQMGRRRKNPAKVSEGIGSVLSGPNLAKHLNSPIPLTTDLRYGRVDSTPFYAIDPTPLQGAALAELATHGMSHAEAKKAPKQDKPTQEVIWCKSCNSVKSDDGWPVSEMSGKGTGVWIEAFRTAKATFPEMPHFEAWVRESADSACSHEMVIGARIEVLPPTSATPDQMSRGKWFARNRADQVHSPVSAGRITSGRIGIFDWHRANVTGSALRRERATVSGMTDTAMLEKILPSGPVRTTRGVSVLTAVDGVLSGDPTMPYLSGPSGLLRTTLHNGKVAKSEAEKAETSTKNLKAANAAKAKKAANAEKSAAAGAKGAKRTSAANAAILADLAELANKVLK